MLMPSIFGESLFDDLFTDDFFGTAPRSGRRYSTPTTAVMKTDIKAVIVFSDISFHHCGGRS